MDDNNVNSQVSSEWSDIEAIDAMINNSQQQNNSQREVLISHADFQRERDDLNRAQQQQTGQTGLNDDFDPVAVHQHHQAGSMSSDGEFSAIANEVAHHDIKLENIKGINY